MSDRIVYGARCTWWDSISNVATKASGLPCCPHCGSPLFEQPDEATWWAGVDAYEADGHPGYRDLIEWGRGRCIPLLGRHVEETLREAKAREGDSAQKVRDSALGLAAMAPDLAPSLQRIANHPALGLELTGAGRIAAERRRQIEAEGYTPAHDDEHSIVDLWDAACAYTYCDADAWPWEPSGFKLGPDRVRELEKAGALFLAVAEFAQRRADAAAESIDALLADREAADV